MSLASPYQESYFVADGSTIVFPIEFTKISNDYVKCIIYFEDGTNCVPTFIVEENNIKIVTLTKPDGTVLTVPPAGSTVRVFRDVPEAQNITASQLQNYTAKQLEKIFDAIVGMIQEVSYSDQHKTVRLTETQRDVFLAFLKEANDDALLYWDNETKTIVPTDFVHQDVVRMSGGLFFRMKHDAKLRPYLEWSINGQTDWHSLNYWDASDTADEAKRIAEEAKEIAEDAKDVADEANDTADEAKGIAEDAKETAEGIEDIAQDALDKVTQEITDRETADGDLQDQIDSLSGRGRFLALWNCATGLAETNPPESPYAYKAGDYFIVGTVSSATPAVNYKPDGSSYTTDVASTTVETNEVSVNDTYFYDGTVWKLQSNAQKEVSFSALAGSPYDNTNLSNALNAKQNVIQVSTMPAASADNLGSIVQWIGATDTYTNGYFYQCALITTPSSATVTANEGSAITDLEINLEDFESYVEPTGDMTLVFTYNGENWDLPDELDVALIDYGISYSGEPVQNDTITVVYTAESSTYGWVEKLVQHGITITYNAETEELTIS